MDRIVLKHEIVDKIKGDPVLTKKIADELRISEKSMPRLLYGNDPKLTQAGVLMILRDYLKVKQDRNLLSEIQICAL